MSNLSGEVFCSRHWSGENEQDTYLLTFYRVIIILLFFSTITASLGNSLILVALRKDTSLHPPSKLLLRSLTITDLCVGAISKPLFITYLLLTLNENWNLCRVFEYLVYVVNTIFPGVSLFTLTAIGVDRLLALLLRLRYRQVVTVKRVRVAVFLFWLISTAIGIIPVWNAHLFFIVSGAVVLLFVAISTYSYTRIFRTIRRQQTQVQDAFGSQNTGLNTVNMARYKKTVFSALWIHLTLVTCYLPFIVITVLITIRGFSKSLFLPEILTVTLVYVNSTLNPFIYCWKMKEVRQAVKETVLQLWTSCSS
ncbi:adenosine receptor A3-like [Oculina patagonica]